MIIVEEKRLKMSFEEKRDWISYGKWMISLTPLDVTFLLMLGLCSGLFEILVSDKRNAYKW